jgi:probable HAF family extracellular repeat protein
MVDLGTLGGPDSAARAVNDAGQIVGRSNLNIIILGSYVYRATLWEAGVPQDLGTVDGQYNSDAYGINESGLVVGTSYTNNPGHATLWDHGSNIDLDALLSPQLPANYRLTKALRINNKGNILLAGLDASGNPVFYLATAVSPTHVTLASTVNPSLSGDPVLLVATVTADSGGTPTTAVTFEDGSSVLGTGILDSSGRATLRVFLGVGTHPLTASFKGYVPYGSSTSAVYTQRVRLKLIPTPH